MTASNPRDQILIRGLAAQGIHGVLPAEKLAAQPFVVDVELDVDLSVSADSDDLADTVSYAEVADDVVAVIETTSVDLIEHLADRIVAACLRRDAVESATVTLHKPRAPLLVTFDDVAVRMRRGRQRLATVALGGNLGGTEQVLATLSSAVQALAELPATHLLAVSQLVESDALPTQEDSASPQPDYLNAVALLRTDLHPRTLLRHLHEIEHDHQRVRAARWGARTLDLDLIEVAEPGARGAAPLGAPARRGPSWRRDSGPVLLPHPRAFERPFVMWPWFTIDPVGVAASGAQANSTGQPSAAQLRPGPPWPAAVQRWVRGPGLSGRNEPDSGPVSPPAPVDFHNEW